MSDAAWLTSLAVFAIGLALGRWSARVDRREADKRRDEALRTLQRAVAKFDETTALALQVQRQCDELDSAARAMRRQLRWSADG